MLFDVHVVSPLMFPDWVAKTARSDLALNAESYKELARQTVEPTTLTYRLDDPPLFHAIATQEIPPGPGPKITTEAAQSYIGASHAREAQFVGDPDRSADSDDHIGRGSARHSRRPRLGRGQGPPALSLGGMDHQRRPQADRRDVYAARQRDAAARICGRHHDARAAGVRPSFQRLPASGAFQPDLFRPRHHHDLLRGDAVRD